MKRYEPDANPTYNCDDSWVAEMVEHKYGEYVKYEAVKSMLHALANNTTLMTRMLYLVTCGSYLERDEGFCKLIEETLAAE